MNDIVIMKFPPFFNKKQIESINIVNPDVLLFDNQFIANLDDFVFPDSIFYINFGNSFNKSLKYVVLPKYLKKLKLSDVYTQSLNYVSFPETVEILELGKEFNNSLFSVKLPKNLKELILNDKFNAALPSILPDGLEKLILGQQFDFSFNNFVVPQKLKHIKINGKEGNKVLFKTLPKTIENIEVVEYLNFKYHFDFPHLETLIIPFNSKKITIIKECKNLKYVKCSAVEHNYNFLNNLPDSVKKLEIINSLCVDLINLPDSLEELFINIEPKNIAKVHNFAFNLNNPNNLMQNGFINMQNPPGPAFPINMQNPPGPAFPINMQNPPGPAFPINMQNPPGPAFPINMQNPPGPAFPINMQNPPGSAFPINMQYPEYFVKQTNLPITLKTLKLYNEKLLKFFDKIPYDCNIVDMDNIPISTSIINKYNS